MGMRHDLMGQGRAAEWAGRCCVRGDRRTTVVPGADARESTNVVGHGVYDAPPPECRRRARLLERAPSALFPGMDLDRFSTEG